MRAVCSRSRVLARILFRDIARAILQEDYQPCYLRVADRYRASSECRYASVAQFVRSDKAGRRFVNDKIS